MKTPSVRKMTDSQRKRHSIGNRTFRGLLVFTLILGTAAAIFGLYLYSKGVIREYRNKTWILAKTAASVIDTNEVIKLSEEVINIYDSLTPEEQLQTGTEPYRQRFADVIDGDFNGLQDMIAIMQLRGEAVAGYVAAVDLENDRLIYICDSDITTSFCPPGDWDEMVFDDLLTFLFGDDVDPIEKLYGTSSMPAVITRTDQYGYRCTAGCYVMRVKQYPVLLFFDTDMGEVVRSGAIYLLQYVILLTAVAVAVELIFLHRIRKRVVNPIRQMTAAAHSYAIERQSDKRGGRHFSDLDVSTGDEIEELALTMKDMESDITGYVTYLTTAAEERQKISTEMNIARRIQAGMVPHDFPPFPDRMEFDIYAYMNPAREVGGDFYDFFMIDDDHLALAIADVSGKGIPGALFMMSSMIILDNYASLGGISPGRILEQMNNRICRNNLAEMFVTIWLGILELSTGRMTAANAGHEYPAVRRAGGNFELFKDRHSFVVGGMKDMVYKEYELTLVPGDIIFQYSDGVTESTNVHDELFGTDRMLEALNRRPDDRPEELVETLNGSIDEFVGKAPQFDDITMLCLVYHGPVKNTEEQTEKGEPVQ